MLNIESIESGLILLLLLLMAKQVNLTTDQLNKTLSTTKINGADNRTHLHKKTISLEVNTTTNEHQYRNRSFFNLTSAFSQLSLLSPRDQTCIFSSNKSNRSQHQSLNNHNLHRFTPYRHGHYSNITRRLSKENTTIDLIPKFYINNNGI